VAASVLVGVINASGGGLLRDVLVRDEPLIFKPGQYYTLAAFTGCLLFVILTRYVHMVATDAAYLTIGTTFLFRVLTIQFNWTSRPVVRIKPSPPPPPPPAA
jgi:uncharacterized membrane protein YeiH